MARTSISIDSGILNRLRLFSRTRNKTVSEVIQEAVLEKLEVQQTDQVQNTYREIENLQQSFKNTQEDPQYKGLLPDEILYGERGAWSTRNQERHD